MAKYKTYLCGPTDCPNDPDFEHDGYYGCVPKDFSTTTGRSKKYRQVKHAEPNPPFDYRYRWNGGCDAAVLRDDTSRGVRGPETVHVGPDSPTSPTA